MTAGDVLTLISGWAIGLLTMYFPLRQQRLQAQWEKERAKREEERAKREEERANREEERANREEERANREEAASFLQTVADALRCIERDLRERRLPPHDCGHKFELLLEDYYQQKLQPYLEDDRVRNQLGELRELARQARAVDEDIYRALHDMGLTESQAASGDYEGLPDPANDPVQGEWLRNMQGVAGELEGLAAGLASRQRV